MKRLVWAEIHLKNLTHNYQALKKTVGEKVLIMPILKANAYGHGIVPIAKHLEKLGADYFGVACLYEAEKLKKAKIKTPILILGYSDEETSKEAIRQGFTITVISEEALSFIAREAGKFNKKVRIHIEVDSGMGRCGLLPEEALRLVKKVGRYKNIELEGIYTHFATADENKLDFSYLQLATFNKFIMELKKIKRLPPIIHAAASAAVVRMPESHFNMVRPGIALVGYESGFRANLKLKKVLDLKTKIVQIKRIKKGYSVGYGRKFIATKDTVVATIPIGYADGFRRSPYGFKTVVVDNKRAKVVGNISMDQANIDITGFSNVKIGQEVVVIGEGQDANEIAKDLGTINYEVLSSISDRVERVYS